MPKTKKAIAKAVKEYKPKYVLEMIFNGETFTVKTDNVDEAIINLKPEQLLTELYIKLTNGEMVVERRMNLVEGRKLFINEVTREVMVNNLLLN